MTDFKWWRKPMRWWPHHPTRMLFWNYWTKCLPPLKSFLSAHKELVENTGHSIYRRNWRRKALLKRLNIAEKIHFSIMQTDVYKEAAITRLQLQASSNLWNKQTTNSEQDDLPHLITSDCQRQQLDMHINDNPCQGHTTQEIFVKNQHYCQSSSNPFDDTLLNKLLSF